MPLLAALALAAGVAPVHAAPSVDAVVVWAGPDDPGGPYFEEAPADAEAVHHAVVVAPHGQALALLGEQYQHDVAFCATLDALDSCESW